MFLAAVDAHFNWPEMAVLKQIFAAIGMPKQLISYSGHQFGISTLL